MTYSWERVSATVANAMLVAFSSALVVLALDAQSGHSNTDLIFAGSAVGLGHFGTVVGLTRQLRLELETYGGMIVGLFKPYWGFFYKDDNEDEDEDNDEGEDEDNDEDGDSDDGEDGTDNELYRSIPNGGTRLVNNPGSSNNNTNQASIVPDTTASEPFDVAAFFDALQEISRNETNSRRGEGFLGGSTVLVPSTSTAPSALELSMGEGAEENEASNHNHNNNGEEEEEDNNDNEEDNDEGEDDEDDDEDEDEDEDEDQTDEIAVAQ